MDLNSVVLDKMLINKNHLNLYKNKNLHENYTFFKFSIVLSNFFHNTNNDNIIQYYINTCHTFPYLVQNYSHHV